MKLFVAILVAAFGFAAALDYTNSWAVEVHGGRDKVDALARKHGFVNEGQVGNLRNIYHFKLPENQYSLRGLGKIGEPVHGLTKSLKQEEGVDLVEQQVHIRHFKRGYSPPSDPLWNQQWSLLNTGQVSPNDAGNDLNVVPAWIQGVTGCNSVVAIVDDGVEYNHTDLEMNYDQALGYNYIDENNDPFPDTNSVTGKRDSHGTSVAGEIGMYKDNGKCGVGVAYRSTITAIKLIDATVGTSDMTDAKALTHREDIIEIYSNSWGPPDDGETVAGPGSVTRMAFEAGSKQGRKGKGSIWVWAAGNGGYTSDSCAADGYASSIYTIAIGAANSNGTAAPYDEQCSAKMAVVLVQDQFEGIKPDSEILLVSTTDVENTCTKNFCKTSAACPLVSGAIALALEVNRGLTWRDVQYLVAYTSNPRFLTTDDWDTNGAGLLYSHQFGFGAVDAEAMVTRARTWINVPQQLKQTFTPTRTTFFVGVSSDNMTNFTIDSTSSMISHLEHVIVTMTITGVDADSYRGCTAVGLTSPSGTISVLLFPRPLDESLEGYQSWPFMSVNFWGENPVGTWSLEVERGNSGSVNVSDITMTLYGTASIPEAVSRIPSTCDPACARGCAAAGPEFCDACANLRNAETLKCIDQCPAGFTERHRYCYNASLPEPQCDHAGDLASTSWVTIMAVWFTIVCWFM